MKIQHPSAQTGFTLIELMITIAVFMILIFVGTSLTRTWVDRSQVNSALSTLKTAIHQAKASALRNTNNQPLSNSAVSICLDSSTNTLNIIRTAVLASNVCDISSGTSASDNVLLRSMPLSSGIFINQGNTTFECLSYNAAGVLIKMTGTSCTSNSTEAFKVGKNDETAEIKIL
jgi:type IV pilus assembly protein PilA